MRRKRGVITHLIVVAVFVSLLAVVSPAEAGNFGTAASYLAISNDYGALSQYYGKWATYYKWTGDGDRSRTYLSYAYQYVYYASQYSYYGFLYAYYGYVATGTDLGYYGYLYAYNDYYYKNLAATYLYYMYGYGQDYSAKAWESVYYEDAYNGYASLFVGLASEGGAY